MEDDKQWRKRENSQPQTCSTHGRKDPFLVRLNFPKVILTQKQSDAAFASRQARLGPDAGKKLTDRGIQNYRDGRYQRAAQLLWMACELHRYPLGAAELADIYHRNLDDGNHSQEEAAHWYIVAAQSGDPNVYSYLMTIDKDILEREDNIQVIVEYWKSK